MLTARRSLLRGRIGRGEPAVPRPPWALSGAAFTSACTRCGECSRACPEGVITCGDGGFPRLDVRRAGCTFCGACLQACEHGALRQRADARPLPWVAHIGSSCLARRRIECRSCGDACEARALRFRPRAGGPPLPALDESLCTGCGACVSPCPVAAISLQPVDLPGTASA